MTPATTGPSTKERNDERKERKEGKDERKERKERTDVDQIYKHPVR